ncbi:MAG: hypothetical protein Q8S39_15795, partial [Ignavibacteria bacterium]|nr:hypothetical protein [Ignavibacteria bacterium]
MKCYIIIYDLRNPGRDYKSLYEAIKSFGTWGKITESTWAIVSTLSSFQIYEFLSKHIDNNDRLFIIKSGKDATWLNAIADNEWLKKHLIL